ncbi:MAG: hypothetical protein J0M18_17320 [Ignavibacteria bacterium]|jgi:hypothetical protein|nr:hypothetical protein [Ignavibacteria bacterium]
MEAEKKEKIEKEKIELGFSVPDTDTKKEADEKRIKVMDEKVEEGTPERPTQEDGGKAE